MMSFTRLLPLSLFAIIVLLSIKIIALTEFLMTYNPILAQNIRHVGTAVAAPAPAAAPSAPDVKAAPPAAPASDSTTKAPESPAPAEPEAADEPTVFDANNLSSAEIKVLEKLNDRRKTLDQREKLLDQRESVLKTAKADLDGRIVEFTALKKILDETKTELQSLSDKIKEEDHAKMERLATVYKSMKPKDAAAIFNQLDPKVVEQLLNLMKPSDAAQILALMDPAIAKKITMNLASQRLLPELVSKE